MGCLCNVLMIVIISIVTAAANMCCRCQDDAGACSGLEVGYLIQHFLIVLETGDCCCCCRLSMLVVVVVKVVGWW